MKNLKTITIQIRVDDKLHEEMSMIMDYYGFRNGPDAVRFLIRNHIRINPEISASKVQS